MKFIFAMVLSFLMILSSSAFPTHVEDQVQNPSSIRAQRQAAGGSHHDAVDFGAHTGDHGAFGWYADFPVHAY
ncbi:uncharacterized protein LOC126890679 isoform X2 [Diabrotica virgifera virgifera]|uniref:Uncharacterized protein n=1 Tax=Diabrotica virgifera virgifera TaxID=50390 RepID=A0ABM5KZZ6_DIAVI|nr:uncharacterized protein LOC126890679 isoform X1 [Diabrotica virgifera virgifera]XP_050515761.1 uncharacterized protein LOC126890679 isoform X2 [Diabrotica virgifera virgifera]